MLKISLNQRNLYSEFSDNVPTNAMLTPRSSSFQAASAPASLFLLPASCRRQCLLTLTLKATYATQPPQSRPASTAIVNRASLLPQKARDRVNPPISTLPAPLDVPQREPGQGALKYYLGVGKLYLGFYKTGIKNVWGNFKLAREVRGKLQQELERQRKEGKSVRGNLVDGVFPLSRNEFQLLKRNRSDISRVPLFGLLFAVFGEWLPLIVVFVTPVVPYPCRIPTQVEKTRKKLEARRRESFRGQIDGFVPDPSRVEITDEASKWIDVRQARHIGRSLGLHTGLWDRLSKLGIPKTPPSGIIMFKTRRHVEYLKQDDKLIMRDGGVKGLTPEEVRMSCEERGIDVLGRPDKLLKDQLENWLALTKGKSEEQVRLLLSR